MNKIIGIDLGTTNSCVAIIDGDNVKVIENTEGHRTTPSVVGYTENEILVGLSAKRQTVTNSKNTISAVKRLIGKKFNDSTIQQDLSLVPYKIVPSVNGDAWVEIKNKPISPEQISAEVLKKMKKTAEDYLGEIIKDAVITVPAYFNDAQRQATKDAGAIAGLNVVRIINEPTAAALAFGMDKIKKDQKIVIFDAGGGTHDVSIIDVMRDREDYTYEVVSTSGDTHLGGEDIDNAVINYMVEEFLRDQKINLKQDILALQRLKEAAEKAKIELSSTMQTEINLPYITADSTGPKHLVVKLTRAKFESLIEPLVERFINPVKIALKDAGLSVNEIDDIILVGGSTRIPIIQQKVKEFFGKDPRKDVNPDEAVAIGAAIQGGILSGSIKDILLMDVTPLSLGIETVGNVAVTIIPKNSTIPTSKSQTFSTYSDNQDTVTIHVVQGERKVASQNKSLGQFNLTGIPPQPRGIPQIEVKFNVDSNGILTVTAKDKATNKEQTVTIQAGSGLSQEEIDRMIADAQQNEQNDILFEEKVKLRNHADHVIHLAQQMISTTEKAEVKSVLSGGITKVNDALKIDNIEDIKQCVDLLEQAIHQCSPQPEQPNDAFGDMFGDIFSKSKFGGGIQDADIID